MQCVELFTGCGGLAMGLSRAGIKAVRMVEWDKHSVQNVLHNQRRGIEFVKAWPLREPEDVRRVSWEEFKGIDVVAGGPPCQPFSIGGLHRGEEDDRDMWPEAVRAVREIQPRAFIFENVRGLTRAAFAEYLEWVKLSLSRPELDQGKREGRASHLARLRKEAKTKQPQYDVKLYSVNAADYGAAQKRHRVFLLGVARGSAPLPELKETHSREVLLWEQWITKEYWDRHGIRVPLVGPDRQDAAEVERLRRSGERPKGSAWLTVRDELMGLGEPGTRSDISNHVFQPGARSYPGHTGSPIDQPAKALKAGVHGVPGGENMMALPDGSVRYFTVREAARLQGLPDEYEFIGAWSENMRQCGNAVPARLAEFVGRELLASLRLRQGRKKKAAA